MRVIVPGHRYALQNLKSDGETILQFYQDGEIHGQHVDGPSCQEVLRALIERIQRLNEEKPWPRNHMIIRHGRMMLAEFEMRALHYKVAKGDFAIETMPTGADGHII